MSEILERQKPDAWLIRRRTQTRNWLRKGLGIDRAIGFTILARGWSSLAGLVTVTLIARFLSPAEQGYYFTFGSLIALQIIFELGFSFVILQMASHESASLTIAADGTIGGDPVAHARLASVLQKTVRWYTAIASLLAAFLLIAGFHFFSLHQHGGEVVFWRIPWCAAALATTVTFQLDPIVSFLEGCGFVPNVARLRLVQAMSGSGLAWFMLIVHHGLFAPAMILSANALVASFWLFRRRNLLLPLLRHSPGEHRIRWMTEVMPFQWRIAVSWLCGYFIYQLYNPVLFAYKGPIAAGQMGMSLNIANAISAVAIAWINTKAAPFGAMIARKEYSRLDQLFFLALKQSIAVCVVGGLVVWLGVIYLNWAHFSLAHRLLDPVPLGLLLLTTLLNITIFAEALYLRAHKQEKFLLNSVLGAILVSASTYFLGRSYGALGIVGGSLIIGVLLGLPWATYTFVKYRKIWHAA
jgi:O-antigen/teichoic acid export membrane protein